MCYETMDGKRIGFQNYNIFGNPGIRQHNTSSIVLLKSIFLLWYFVTTKGSKFEARPHNVTFGHEVYRTSLMPVKVYGLDYFILLDRDGFFYDNGRLYDMIKESTENKVNLSANKTGPGVVIDSKEDRIKHMKSLYQRNKNTSHIDHVIASQTQSGTTVTPTSSQQ